MEIRYEGPCSMVNVAPFGAHVRGMVKTYPDDFGAELLRTSKRQQFTVVEEITLDAKRPDRAKKKSG